MDNISKKNKFYRNPIWFESPNSDKTKTYYALLWAGTKSLNMGQSPNSIILFRSDPNFS